MGSGGAKAHEASAVVPSGATGDVDLKPAVSPESETVLEHFSDEAATTPIEDLAGLAAKTLEEAGLNPGDTETTAEAIEAAIDNVVNKADPDELLAAAGESGLPMAKVLAESGFAAEPALQAAVGKYLASGDVDEQLAIHVSMVALASGEDIPPEWVESLEHLEGDETWTGSLAEFKDAVENYEELKKNLHNQPPLEMLAAINKVWGYQAPEGLDGADELVGWMRQKCPNPPSLGSLAQEDVQHLPGVVSEVDKQWLTSTEAFQVASMATPMTARLKRKAKAQVAEDTVQVLSALSADAWSTPPASTDELAAWVGANAKIAAARNNPAIHGMTNKVFQAGGVAASPASITTNFRKWAKKQKLSELTQVAVGLGLTNTHIASRSHVQNYLAAQWDPQHKTADINAALDAKAKSPEPSPAPATKVPAQQPAKAKMSKTMAATPVASTSNAFHQNVVSLANKAATAKGLAADVPAPTSPAAIDKHDWAGNHLGAFSKGSHESHLYTGPDGNDQWLFKPDKSNHGARAYAEAAASKIFAAAGVPTVDVHVAKIGNRIGAIQPMIPGAKDFSTQPSQWTQSDVDQIVANHVVSWAVGDHDGHGANMLRTPSGAVVGIDHGQAFKFTGTDKLSADWKPSTNPTPAVHSQLYAAAKNGNLAPGVTIKAAAAIPAIKKLQNVDDATYASWLTPTATEGVKHSVHWVASMRKAAQANHGTKNVTDAQVAQQFVTTMVERKNSLSTSFSSFLSKQGVTDATHIPMLAPQRKPTAA